MASRCGLIPNEHAIAVLKRRAVRDLESTIAEAEILGVGDDEFVTRCRLGRDDLLAEIGPLGRSTVRGSAPAPLRLVAP